MASMRYQQSLAAGLHDAMADDPQVLVMGEDVGQSLRGVTRGLQEEFGAERVIDMPLSEQAFTSFATGLALSGFRPVVEYQIPSLLYLVFEQIVNQAQKFRLMTGGQASVPVTYLVPGSGARQGLAGQHSDHPYSFFVHAGVKTVVPATPEDAYGLFRSAINDDDPVAVFAPAAALGVRTDAANVGQLVPLGVGRIHRPGTDVTVLAVGHLVHDALAVAADLADEISVEVVDPRTVYPMDWNLLAESLERTGRLVVFDDANVSCGFAAEVVATAAESMHLVAPPRRVTRADAVVPFAVALERVVLPSREQLTAAIHGVMKER
ncbi:MAG: transketolase C-terminal domain-containing protein [Propionibacteriaceae bacterium]